MPSKAEQFQAQADDCEEKAKATKNDAARQTFRDAARIWREMAEEAKRAGAPEPENWQFDAIAEP